MEKENIELASEQAKEERRKWIVDEITRLRNTFGNSADNEAKLREIQELDAELIKLAPPPTK